MRRGLLALSFIALAASATAQDFIALTPEQIGQVFCIARLGNDMAPVEGLLTPALKAEIASAWEQNAAWEKANPGDKPPLGDGIPWQTYPDYAAECTVGAVSYMMDEADLPIAYGYPGYPDAAHTDTLQLRLIADPAIGEKVWRIDNLAFATDGDLRTSLKVAFMDN